MVNKKKKTYWAYNDVEIRKKKQIYLTNSKNLTLNTLNAK